MLEGKKTRTGAVLLFIAGGLYIGGLYDAILYDVGIGLSMMGAGLVAWGIHNCMARALFNVHDGKIMHKSGRIESRNTVGG